MQPGGCHTSHTSKSHRGGFTLLEMVFVLAIIAVLTTWMTLSVTTVNTEKKLREASGAIESLAKRARAIAIMQQRPYRLFLSADEISISPLHTVGGIAANRAGETSAQNAATGDGFEDITVAEAPDSEVSYEIKRWRSGQWEPLDGEKKIALTIDPMGLIEPISIRCSMGKSWLVQELHPLTAGIRDEQMSIEKE